MKIGAADLRREAVRLLIIFSVFVCVRPSDMISPSALAETAGGDRDAAHPVGVICFRDFGPANVVKVDWRGGFVRTRKLPLTGVDSLPPGTQPSGEMGGAARR